MGRYLLNTAVLCFGFLVFFGFSSPAWADGEDDERDRVFIRMADLPSPLATGPNPEAQRQIVSEFSEQHPYVDIERFYFMTIGDRAMDEGPLRAIISGVPPHGIYVNFRQSATYINHGFLAPMEILLARIKSDNPRVRETDENDEWLEDPTEEEVAEALAMIRERVIDPAWPVVYREADTDRKGVPEGKHVWSLPMENLVQGLRYRRDVFEDAGLDPNNPPRTHEELLEQARKIRARVDGAYGIMFPTGTNVSYHIINFLASYGVELMVQDEEGVWRAGFDSREAAEAVYFVLRLVRERFDAGDYGGEEGRTMHGVAFAPMGGGPEMGMLWDQGRIGMQFQDMSMTRPIDPVTDRVAPIPQPEETDEIKAGQVNCRMMGVFADADPQQQLAVMRFLWFRSGERGQEVVTRSFVNHGEGRFVDPDLLEKFGYTDILREVPDDWKETLEVSFERGVPEPYGRDTQHIYEYSSGPINWAIRNEALLDLPKEEALDRIQDRLREAAERTDRHMLGELTEEEWRRRRIVGGGALVIIAAIFTLAITWVFRKFTEEERKMGPRPNLRKYIPAYVFMLPGLFLLFFIDYLPLILGIPIALFDYQMVLETAWVGLDNFATVLYDPRFWASVGRTFYYVLLVIGLGFWPPILVAILLDELPTQPMKYTFRTIFYLPSIVSGVIMVFLWRQLYDPSEDGFLNQIILVFNELGPVTATIVRFFFLGLWFSLIGFIFLCAFKLKELSWPVRSAIFAFALGILGVTLYPLIGAYIGPGELVIEARGLDPEQVTGWSGLWNYLSGFIGSFEFEPLGWIEDPGLAMVCVVIPMVWASAGPGCIIYLAALKTVPEELVEAATIDGAGIIQKISYITLPRIKFLILIQLLSAVVSAFRGGTNMILVMTGGGPDGATRTLGLDIFERAWFELKFSEGAAMGWILGAIVITMTCYQLRRMSRATFKSAATDEAKQQSG